MGYNNYNKKDNAKRNNGGYNNGFNKKPRPQKERFKPITLEFTYMDFESGISELRKHISLINDIINAHPSLVNAEEISEKQAKEAIIMDIADKVPLFGDKATQFYSLATNYLKTFYKTPNFIGFGWECLKAQGKNFIDAYTFKVVLYSDREELKTIKENLELAGYEVVKSPEKK